MSKKTVEIGQIYSLDLGSQTPVVVEPIEYLDNGKVLVRYLNSWAGRTEEFDYVMFGSDYTPPEETSAYKKRPIKFDLSLDSCDLIQFVSDNMGKKWDEVCDMEYAYRHSDRFETANPYPLVPVGEMNESTFQYWVERFLETYEKEIDNRQVYIIQ